MTIISQHQTGICVFLESLKGARVLVTGASTGIGEQLAYHYARLGAQLVITARRGNVLEEVNGFFFFLSSFTFDSRRSDCFKMIRLTAGCAQVPGNGGSKGPFHTCGHGEPFRCRTCGRVHHRTARGVGFPGSEPHRAQSIRNVEWRRGSRAMAAWGVESQWNK